LRFSGVSSVVVVLGASSLFSIVGGLKESCCVMIG
jgi:hypothetical protein